MFEDCVHAVVGKVADFLHRDGNSLLLHDPNAPPGASALFRPINESLAKYQTPDWLETGEPEPEDLQTLLQRAGRYKNLAIHTNFGFAGNAYPGTLYVYTSKSSPHESRQTQIFTRIGFHSALAYALRGTKQFGGPVHIDSDVKAGILEMAIGLARVLGAEGFLYGLERIGPMPFTIQELEACLRNPNVYRPPMPMFVAGIQTSLLTRAELIQSWKEEVAIKEATAGFVLLDLLADSDGDIEDDDEKSDPGELNE